MSTFTVKALSNPQRIITDLQIIASNLGLAIEYWHKETGNLNQLTSASRCPKSNDGLSWIYFQKPSQCYMAGTPGGCPAGQNLWLRNGSHIGICTCECFVDVWLTGYLQYKANHRYQECRCSCVVANPYRQVFDTEENIC